MAAVKMHREMNKRKKKICKGYCDYKCEWSYNMFLDKGKLVNNITIHRTHPNVNSLVCPIVFKVLEKDDKINLHWSIGIRKGTQ